MTTVSDSKTTDFGYTCERCHDASDSYRKVVQTEPELGKERYQFNAFRYYWRALSFLAFPCFFITFLSTSLFFSCSNPCIFWRSITVPRILRPHPASKNPPCPCRRGSSALSYSSTSNGTSLLAGATVAFGIFNTRACAGCFYLPIAQRRSRVRN